MTDVQDRNAVLNPTDNQPLNKKEWENVQKKTFTNWINNKLKLRQLTPIAQLDTDLSSGEKLIELLEIIGDESMGKYNRNPRMRIQKIENQNMALAFIKKHNVGLTNIGAEDLVDANPKLTLGLVWSIILRFTIADITEGGLSAKDGLLLWVQKRTAPYKNDFVVEDFTYSWQNALALCALIHRHRPDLLDYYALDKDDIRFNMNLAFDIAEKHLGIAKLFNAEDIIDTQKPDERSVITYVAQYFHAFSALDKILTAGRRVEQFGQLCSQAWNMQHDYEQRASALKNNIAQIQSEWNQTQFTSYPEGKRQLIAFDEYKSGTKRQWNTEKRELESLFNNIQMKLRTYNMSPYIPADGLAPADISKCWSGLLKHEAERKTSITNFIKEIKETLKKDFANKANGVQKQLDEVSNKLSSATGDLDQQLVTIQQLAQKLVELAPQLQAVKASEDQVREAQIEDNEYTILSFGDIEFEHNLLQKVMVKQSAFVQNQITARGMSNITPEQLESYSETFKHLDSDHTNTLNREDFKAALRAEGVDQVESEYEKTFQKASSGKGYVSFENYLQFMTQLEEDRTSPEQLINAFGALSHQRDHVTEADLTMGSVNANVVEFFKQAMPKKEEFDGLDYKQYLAHIFGKGKNAKSVENLTAKK